MKKFIIFLNIISNGAFRLENLIKVKFFNNVKGNKKSDYLLTLNYKLILKNYK